MALKDAAYFFLGVLCVSRCGVSDSQSIVSVKSYVYIKILELGEEKAPHEFTCFGAFVASHCYVECRITFLLPGYVLVD